VKPLAGFVLAGGESSRMGREKALLELHGEPLVALAAKLVESVTSRPAIVIGFSAQSLPDLRVVADDWPGAGPLGGIATALRVTDGAWNVVIACDLPYLTRDWLAHLVARALASKGDAVVPMNERGAEPLCAAYHKRCEPAVRSALQRGVRKVTDGLAGVRVESIEPAEWKAFDSDGYLFKNMNSPADYEEAKARLRGSAKR